MKRQSIFFILITFFCLNGCNKNDDGIFIRVENSTSQDFKKVIINNKGFDNVSATEITSYQSFESALTLPLATLVIDINDTTYAGLGSTYYDRVEYLNNGKYTLKVFEDTANVTGFDCVYIKN